MRPRRAFISFLGFALYVVVALALTEAGLRFLGYRPRMVLKPHPSAASSMPDDRLGWVSSPGTYTSPEAGQARMTFSPDHSRRSWRTPIKIGQRGEVLVVGCSFTEGFGIADEETFSWLLNVRYPYLMFHNFGTGGYGTYQSLLRIKENVSDADTDDIPLVIYGFIDLHMQRNVAAPNWVRSLATGRDHYIVPPHVRLGQNGLDYYGPETLSFWPLESHSALITVLTNAWLELHLHSRGSQLAPTTMLIEQMNEWVAGHRKRFLVVLLNRAPSGLIPFLETHRIDYVNCDNPAFDRVPSAFRLDGTGHPNASQDALWAACIGNWIDQNLTSLAGR